MMNRSPYSAAEVAPLTTMACFMFFGTMAFACTAMAVKSLAAGDDRAFQAALNPRSSALDTTSFASIYTLLHHSTILGLILFYAYICEYHPPFPHGEKSYDRDWFFFLTALLFVAASFTLKSHVPPLKAAASDVANDQNHRTTEKSTTQQQQRSVVAPANEATELLNRDQTEEWKGWMQFMFLLYHYCHAEEVYNAIRIMITCYVWMTGFGNFSFFYLKADYGLVRVLQMLWRLNFLVLFLCLSQGTTYILYYICLLHTYFFLVVYATMRVAQNVNYTMWGIRIKLSILAIIIYLVWDVDSGLFRLVHRTLLGTSPVLGATSGSLWEWYFRSTLDHWSTFLGMVFALNFPITSLFFRKLEAQPFKQHVLAKGAIGLGFATATYLWVVGPFQQGKFDYNATNAYYGCIPLLAYIYFRNLTPWLRSHTLNMLHEIGKTTLETYLMQHHIWLTSNAKSLLILLPGWPKVNFLLVTIIYFVLSRRLYKLTLYLRGMILPNDRNTCLLNLAVMGIVLLVFVALASFLRVLGILDVFTVGLFSLSFGYTLYRLILLRTWNSLQFVSSPDHTSKSNGAANSVSSNVKKICGASPLLPPLVASLVIVLLGTVWHQMARGGAGKIQPVPSTCAALVQNGSWVPVDACNEGTRGASYRDYGVASFGTCSPQNDIYAWGWESSPSSSHCRFAQRDSKALLKTLQHRNITFIGDSIIRHLYHATCRQVGDSTAGAYNTSMGKWQDFSRHYGKKALEFRWAPFTDQMTEVLRRLPRDNELPDLIVLGGGAWDRLHRYGNETQRTQLNQNVSVLVKEMNQARRRGVPLVWVVPTTINTWGLASPEKQANIREVDIAEVRIRYEQAGINDAATFVLDGPSFTADRVTESYDGVHYPLSVYDGGAQILANALDWLLLDKDTSDRLTPPHVGSMSNPFLGLIMLVFVFIGLFYFDGFMGLSYLAAWVTPSLMPRRLFEEAFLTLHAEKGLPAMEIPARWRLLRGASDSYEHDHSSRSKSSDAGNEQDPHDELESFLDHEEHDVNEELELESRSSKVSIY